MDSRRLVVWISTGILVFQGATLAFDLLNCTALSWLTIGANGLPAMERQVDRTSSPSGLADPDASHQSSADSSKEHPAALFCVRPQGQIDEAVNQGMSVLAGQQRSVPRQWRVARPSPATCRVGGWQLPPPALD
jgi:hypothetical protein